jgi:hypothetical protein
MKAWTDLEKDSNICLYWTGVPEEPKSHWYIDHGVKIERFTNGTIEINNAMKSGDDYEPVSTEERQVFETEGWLIGCYTVCINTYSDRLFTVNELIKANRPSDDMDKLMYRKAVLIKKIERYTDLLDKALSLQSL